tara:strand:- start:377 stop:601 length:225 start_codon:yes stop_codon:yes gene_type:complete
MADNNKNTKNTEKAAPAKKSLPSPFDKFINDQLRREEAVRKNQEKFVNHGETPQQKYNKLYRENPSNRTVWSKK